MVECFSTGAKELNDAMLIPIISNNQRIICQYGRKSESSGQHSARFTFLHHSLHIGTEQQIQPSNLRLFNVLYLDDVADVSLSQSLKLLHLFNGIIVLVLQQICTTKFIKMALGVKGVSVLTFAWYLMTMCVGTDSSKVDAVAVGNFLW